MDSVHTLFAFERGLDHSCAPSLKLDRALRQLDLSLPAERPPWPHKRSQKLVGQKLLGRPTKTTAAIPLRQCLAASSLALGVTACLKLHCETVPLLIHRHGLSPICMKGHA